MPYISSPIRNTFAATQTAPTTAAAPIAIDSQTCHHGGGWVDAIRMSIPNVLTGGRKLTTRARVESGERATAGQKNQGTITATINGPCSDAASFMSLTAAPTASMSEPSTRKPSTKKIPR